MTKKLSKSQLDAALASLAAAHYRAAVARDKIMAHCDVVYGVQPGDIDNDRFIDGVDGGCGRPSGLSTAEFYQSMVDAMVSAGMELPDGMNDAAQAA
jgi:hypothetical protein